MDSLVPLLKRAKPNEWFAIYQKTLEVRRKKVACIKSELLRQVQQQVKEVSDIQVDIFTLNDNVWDAVIIKIVLVNCYVSKDTISGHRPYNYEAAIKCSDLFEHYNTLFKKLFLQTSLQYWIDKKHYLLVMHSLKGIFDCVIRKHIWSFFPRE